MSVVQVPAAFSGNELLAMLAQDEGSEVAGLTVEEMAEAVGHSGEWVRKRIKRLMAAGTVEHVVLRRPALDGRLRVFSGYAVRRGDG